MITKEQLKFLAASAEFQKLLEEDEHIRELEASKYNRREEFLALRSVLLLPSCIGPLRIRPVTPAIWSYLWALGNNYTGDIRKADDMDTDIFLYLLSHDLHDLYDTPAELTGNRILREKRHRLRHRRKSALQNDRTGVLPSADAPGDFLRRRRNECVRYRLDDADLFDRRAGNSRKSVLCDV